MRTLPMMLLRLRWCAGHCPRREMHSWCPVPRASSLRFRCAPCWWARTSARKPCLATRADASGGATASRVKAVAVATVPELPVCASASIHCTRMPLFRGHLPWHSARSSGAIALELCATVAATCAHTTTSNRDGYQLRSMHTNEKGKQITVIKGRVRPECKWVRLGQSKQQGSRSGASAP